MKMSPAQKSLYAQYIAVGNLKYEAARKLGIGLAVIKRHYDMDPEFQVLVDEAQDMANEPVERALYDAATRGEPWAVKEWLTKRDKARWGDDKTMTIQHEGQVSVGAGASLTALTGLLEKLQDRSAGRTALDAHSVETTGTSPERPPFGELEPLPMRDEPLEVAIRPRKPTKESIKPPKPPTIRRPGT